MPRTLKHSLLYSTCVSEYVYMIAKLCAEQSLVNGTQKQRKRRRRRRKQARMSILSFNLLPKWVIEIHFHDEQKSFNQVTGDQMSRNIIGRHTI